MVLWKMTLREIAKHPGRAILTLLSVVIGVAAVVSVLLATKTSRTAFKEMFRTVTGRASLEVVTVGGEGFDEELLAKVESVAGVQFAAPVIRRDSSLFVNGEKIRLVVLGIDLVRDQKVRDATITDGRYLTEADIEAGGCLLEAGLARNFRVSVGDELEYRGRRINKEPVKVVGLIKPQGAAAYTQSSVLFVPLAEAQRTFRAVGKIDRIQIVVDEKADAKTVESLLQARLPEGVTFRKAESRNQQAEETSLSTEQGLKMAQAFSFLLAVFIVMNTFLMNVSQRRRQLAIMRAIGATRKQVVRLIYREAVLMGVLGTIVGALTGVAGAYLLTRAMGKLYLTTLPPVELTWPPFALGAAFGLGVSVIGAYVPARRAGRMSPLEAMSAVLIEDRTRPTSHLTLLGVFLLIAGACFMYATYGGYLPIMLSVGATILILIGLVMLLPATVGSLSLLPAAVLHFGSRVEAGLARRQLLRQRSRTTLTIGVLFVAVTTGTGLASSIIDNVNDVKDWYRKTIIADFYVRATIPDVGNIATATLPDEVEGELRATSGIERIDSLRFVKTQIGEEEVLVIAHEYPTREDVRFDVAGQDETRLYDDLQAGKVVIGSVLGQRLQRKAGDKIKVSTSAGDREFDIAAVVNDYFAGGLVMHMKRNVAQEAFGFEGVDVYLVHAAKGQVRALDEKLGDMCEKFGIVLSPFEAIRTTIDGMMTGVVASLWAVLLLGIVVAAFGVVNTLTMNVLEQTRQLGMLRAVAMTRGQVRRMILSQAVVIAGIALPPAVVTGLGMAYMTILATEPVLGHPVKFEFHPGLLAASLVGSFVVVMLAAWFPATRAANLNVVEALHYE